MHHTYQSHRPAATSTGGARRRGAATSRTPAT